MKEKKQVITSCVVKENVIKLPKELGDHHLLKHAEVSINEDVVTFKIGIVPEGSPYNPDYVLEIWQYVHHKEMWVKTRFIK